MLWFSLLGTDSTFLVSQCPQVQMWLDGSPFSRRGAQDGRVINLNSWLLCYRGGNGDQVSSRTCHRAWFELASPVAVANFQLWNKETQSCRELTPFAKLIDKMNSTERSRICFLRACAFCLSKLGALTKQLRKPIEQIILFLSTMYIDLLKLLARQASFFLAPNVCTPISLRSGSLSWANVSRSISCRRKRSVYFANPCNFVGWPYLICLYRVSLLLACIKVELIMIWILRVP